MKEFAGGDGCWSDQNLKKVYFNFVQALSSLVNDGTLFKLNRFFSGEHTIGSAFPPCKTLPCIEEFTIYASYSQHFW
jgi:hypothetical protein